MNRDDAEAYKKRYADRFREFGHDPRTLGWLKGKQRERFRALTSFVPLGEVESVLDVGCGFGDLYPFLMGEGFTGRYVGIDLVPELVEQGLRAHPEAELSVCDLDEFGTGARFDLVVASGIFNAPLRHEDHWGHLTKTLKRMFEVCRVAAAADFMSTFVDYRVDGLYYTAPQDVFAFGKSLTRRVALDHSYMPFEFAVCLFRRDEVLENTTFGPIAG